MKATTLLRAVTALNAVILASAVRAAERVKADNTADLNTGASWVGGSVPGGNDFGRWNNTVTGPNAVLLGGDMSLQGLVIANPGGPVTIGGGHTLTTSFVGFNLSGATADLTLNNQNLTLLEYAGQRWDIAAGRTLTVSPAAVTRSYGASVGIAGAGTVASATLANDATGIIGPWARHGTGTATRYATVSGGNVAGHTGMAAATAAGVTDTTGMANYDVAAVGTLGAGASFNTLRYTGASGTVSGGYTANGLLNAGSGAVTFSGAATVGASRELVLTSPDTTRKLALSGVVADHPGGASGITVTGGGQVELRADNTYNGQTVISAGRIWMDKPNALGTTNGNTVIYINGSNVTGAFVQVSGNITVTEPLLFVGSGDGPPYNTALQSSSGTNTLAGPVTILATTGVRITAGAGAMLNIDGPITRPLSGNSLKLGGGGVGGVVNVNHPIDNNGGNIDLHSGPGTIRFNVGGHNIGNMNVQWLHVLQLGVSDALPFARNLQVGSDATAANNSAGGTFDMAGFDQTVNGFSGNGNASYPPSTRMVTNTAERLSTLTVGYGSSGGTFNGTFGGNLALVKAGTGTQTLCGPNFHTGGTTVNNGTLVLSNAVDHGALTVNGGTFRFPPALTVRGALAGTGGTIDTGAAGAPLTVDQTADSFYAGALTGAGALTKSGEGALTLSGANTLAGGIDVLEGTLCFGSAAAVPAAGVTLAPGANAGLGVGGASPFGADELDALWDNTFPGIVLDDASLVGINTSAGDFTYASSPSTRGLIKTGANTLTLSGASTYTGGTFIRQGALSIPSTGALPGWDTAGRWQVYPDAGLAVWNAVGDAEVGTILGTGNFMDGGCIGFDTTSGNRTYPAAIGNTANGALGVYKVGTNALTLTAASTYDGNTFVAGGIVVVKDSQALGSTNGYTQVFRVGGTAGASYSDATGQVQLDGGAGALTLDENFYINGSEQYNYGGCIRNMTGDNTINGWIRLGNNGRINVGGGNLVLNGPIERSAVSSGPSLVLNPNTGTLTVSNRIDLGTGSVNFHSGGVVLLCATGHVWNGANVQYGNTLRLGLDDALPVNRPLLLGNSTPGNGRFDLNGYNQTVARLQEQGTTASLPNNNITNSSPSALSTFTVNHGAGVADSFGGRIMGSLNLVKAGAADSTLTLRGANAVAGAVFVRGGTLAVDETGTLGAAAGGVTVENGTLFLQNSAALADSTTVRLPETGDGGAKIQLAAGVEERVGWLFYGETMRRAGTYGSTASPAQVKDDARFAGTGVLRVLHDNAGTVITLK